MVNAFFFTLTKIISIYIIFSFIVVLKILKAQNQSTNIYIYCHKKDIFSKVLEGIIKYDIANGPQSLKSQWVYLPETTWQVTKRFNECKVFQTTKSLRFLHISKLTKFLTSLEKESCFSLCALVLSTAYSGCLTNVVDWQTENNVSSGFLSICSIHCSQSDIFEI